MKVWDIIGEEVDFRVKGGRVTWEAVEYTPSDQVWIGRVVSDERGLRSLGRFVSPDQEIEILDNARLFCFDLDRHMDSGVWNKVGHRDYMRQVGAFDIQVSERLSDGIVRAAIVDPETQKDLLWEYDPTPESVSRMVESCEMAEEKVG